MGLQAIAGEMRMKVELEQLQLRTLGGHSDCNVIVAICRREEGHPAGGSAPSATAHGEQLLPHPSQLGSAFLHPIGKLLL